MRTDTRSARSRLLTIEQAAEQLGVTPRMIRRLTGNRQLPFVKVGRLVRIRDTDIARCVEEWTVPAVDGRWSV
ncbi:MAG: excisionase family DNA-binding protein [Actinomycetota bacterium]|nr:excisionase family DNA-binding protein [Actinomycetota bacterium]